MREIEAKDTRSPITLLVPIYNGAAHLPNLRRNIEACAGRNDEILVIDDGSSDGTGRFISNWSKEDTRVIQVQNQAKGLAHALNLGLKLASHEWIARFDVDDFYETRRLASQYNLVSPDVGAIFSDYDSFSSNLRTFGFVPSPIYDVPTSISLTTNRRTPHPSALLNKFACVEVGGYLPNHFPAEDLSLWLRLSKVSRLISVPETLLHYRISNNSVTSIQKSKMSSMRGHVIHTIGITKSKIEQAHDDLEIIVESYKTTSQSDKRAILFLYDLWIIHKMKISPNTQKFNKITPVVAKNLGKYLVAGTNLTWTAAQRRLIRKYSSEI